MPFKRSQTQLYRQGKYVVILISLFVYLIPCIGIMHQYLAYDKKMI